MKDLTTRQKETLVHIYNYRLNNGNSPRFSDLAKDLQVSSKQAVADILNSLQKKGYLSREKRRARAIELTEIALNYLRNINLGIQQTIRFARTETSPSVQLNFNPTFSVVIGNNGQLPSELTDSTNVIRSVSDGFSSNTLSPLVVIDHLNWTSLRDENKVLLFQNRQVITLEPLGSAYIEAPGYTLFVNSSDLILFWNGSTSNHFFNRGNEQGTSYQLNTVWTGQKQLQLFTSNELVNFSSLKKKLNKGLIKFSNWEDFPIYGAALYANGDIMYWSHRTATDPKDLRNLLLLKDKNFTQFNTFDSKLSRDIKANFFENLTINNLTL